MSGFLSNTTHLITLLLRGAFRSTRRHILFRDDCAYDFDSAGKLYHHKDLTKFGRDLSQVLIVDNSALAFKSLEPNAVLIANFYGRDNGDAELDKVLEITQGLIDEMREREEDGGAFDLRYPLNGVALPQKTALYDRRNADEILTSTHRFLNDLKMSLIDKGRLSTKLKFGEPKTAASVDGHEDELATLPKPEEAAADTEVAQLTQTLSTLAASRTSMAYGDEGLATPSGNYGAEAVLEIDSAFAFDAKDAEDAEDAEDEEVSQSQSQSQSRRTRTSSYYCCR